MKWSRRMLIAVMIFCMVFSVSAFAGDFPDTMNHWAKDYISKLTDDGILSGMGDGTFQPDAMVTRAQYFTMINNAFGFADTASVSFSDVSVNDWFYPQIQRAWAAGYLSGYGDNTARPNNNITRAEASVVLRQVLGLPSSQGASNRFADASGIPSWALDAIDAVVGSGLMQGADGYFRPTANLTRAEASVMIFNSRNYDNGGIQQPVTGVITVSTPLYGPASGSQTINSNVLLTNGAGTISNLVINGDVEIDASVAGKIVFENVTVKGNVYINGKLSLTLSKKTYVEALYLRSGAADSTLSVSADSVINTAYIDAVCAITGSGKINSAMISVSGVKDENGVIQSYAEGSSKVSGAAGSSMTPNGGSGGTGGTYPGGSVTPSTVNKSALNAKISEAREMLAATVVATFADEVDYGKSWVYQYEWTELQNAIDSALSVYNNSSATQSDVSSAYSTLQIAMTSFSQIVKQGTKGAPATDDPTTLVKNGYTLTKFEFLGLTTVIVQVTYSPSEVTGVTIDGQAAVKQANGSEWRQVFENNVTLNNVQVDITRNTTLSEYIDLNRTGPVDLLELGTYMYVYFTPAKINDISRVTATVNGTSYTLTRGDSSMYDGPITVAVNDRVDIEITIGVTGDVLRHSITFVE